MNRNENMLSKAKEIDQLETLAFHLTQLSKRLSQDREHWAETGKSFSQAVERLNKTIQAFTEFEQALKEHVTIVLHNEGREAAQMIAKACGETTQRVLREQIEVTTEGLNQAVYQARQTLAQYEGEVSHLKKWFMIGLMFSAFVGNILAGVAVYYLLFL